MKCLKSIELYGKKRVLLSPLIRLVRSHWKHFSINTSLEVAGELEKSKKTNALSESSVQNIPYMRTKCKLATIYSKHRIRQHQLFA